MSLQVVSSLTGYLHPLYAQALAEIGRPVCLPQCGGWVLQRRIPGFLRVDAMGCYPLFLCQDWFALLSDLETLARDWVSLALVTDPFGDYSVEALHHCFPELVLPFKQHYVVDLTIPRRDFVSSHHQRNSRRALQRVKVGISQDASSLIEDWLRLYDTLVRRHHIQGITAFSRQSFALQLQVPGMIAFRATSQGAAVGMLLWYVSGDIAYYHLGAQSPDGYDSRASFALFWAALDYFAASGVRWLDLGSNAGRQSSENDGLSRFKRGWSTGTRTTYFCGRIFDMAAYRELVRERGSPAGGNYFPLYRSGEF